MKSAIRNPQSAIPKSRRELVLDLVAHAAPKVQYVGWVTAITRAYPEAAHPIGSALSEITNARYALDLAEALSRPRTRAPRLSRQALPVLR